MKKRMISLLICFSIMLVWMAPVASAAEDETPDVQDYQNIVVEPMILTGCAECGATDDHATTCSLYVAPFTGCAECGAEDGHLSTCSQYEAPVVGCAECGTTNVHAVTCSQYVPPVTGCAECGAKEGHAVTCSQYVAPVVELSLYEQLMAVTTIEAMFDIMNSFENYEKLFALTTGEIEFLAVRARQLPSVTGDGEYLELVLETLIYLPNSMLAACEDCGQVTGHTADCPWSNATGLAINGQSVFPADGKLVNNKTYTMVDNTTLTTNLTVPSGVTATIDLNGFVLKGTGSDYVINVASGAYLRIIDSNPNLGHNGNINSNGLWEQVDGNYKEQSKGGIINNRGTGKGISISGTCKMEGGMIAGCYSTSIGAAVTATSSGTFIMTGGRIAYNVTAAGSDNRGGVIYGEPAHSNSGSRIEISNASIIGNTSAGDGGAICGYIITLSDTVITDNKTTEGNGGAIYFRHTETTSPLGSLTISNCRIENNVSAKAGGAIYGGSNTTVTISNGASISNNSAETFGGGIYGANITIGGTAGNPVVISNNKALSNSGGGIYVVKDAECYINYGQINDNYARVFGGGICSLSNTEIANSDICNNRAMDREGTVGRGGGIYIAGAGSKTPLEITVEATLTNTKVNGNAAMYYGGGIQVCLGASLELVSGEINSNIAVLHGAGGVHVTGGAEFTLTGGEISGNTAYSVGGAIHSSYACVLNLNGGTIKNNTVYGRGGGVHVNVGGDLLLQGTAISGNKAYNGTNRTGATLNDDLKTWTDIIDDGSVVDGYGGGVVVDAGTCTMTAGSLSGNYAQVGGGGIAFVMINTASSDDFVKNKVVSFTMEGGTISGNTTDGNGAGIYLMKNKLSKAELEASGKGSLVADGKYLEGTPSIEATGGAVTGNIAQGNGGAAYQEVDTQFTISGNAIFYDNTAAKDGGAVYIAQGRANINGGTISNNRAEGDGGALYVNGTVTVTTGTLNGNSSKGNGGAAYITSGNFTMASGVMESNKTGVNQYGVQISGAQSYGGAVFVDGGVIEIGIKNCSGGSDNSKHSGGATHPSVKNNLAVFGGGLAVTDGTVSIYCSTIIDNIADNDGTGTNIYMEGTDSSLDLHVGASVGNVTDHGIVVIGGDFTVHMEVGGKAVAIRYYPNYFVNVGIGKNGEPWVGETPEGFYLNLPYCPNNWVSEQGDKGLAFVGWTDKAPESGNIVVALNFIRDKDDYAPVGAAVQINGAVQVGDVYYMDFYAVWAPVESTISYQYALLPYENGIEGVELKSLDSKRDGIELGTLTTSTTGFVVNGTMEGTYRYYSDSDSTVATSYDIELPSVTRAQYEFKGWALYSDTGEISNWGSDPDNSPKVVGGKYKWGNINHLVTKSADYDLLYQDQLTVDRNFGRITLVAVFERTHADLTISNNGTNLSNTQSTVFTIIGDPAYEDDFSMTVSITGTDSIIIRDLPVGMYTVEEQDAWTWRYAAPTVTDTDTSTAAGTVTVDGNSTHGVTFSGYQLTKLGRRWLSANHWDAILPSTYSLKMKKN